MSRNFSVLVADDEQPSLNMLAEFIQKEPRIKIVECATSGDEALKKILKKNYDIVMLDINMPGLDGIKVGELIEHMKEKPYLIYVTAYEEYAIKALNLGAQGYILKPFTYLDIDTILQKVIKQLDSENLVDVAVPSRKIAVYEGDKILFFDQTKILFIYANVGHVYVVVDNKEYMSHHTLTELEKSLDTTVFFRTHRNYIVNINKITNMVSWFNNTYLINIVCDDKTHEIPLSRDNVKEFKILMHI